LLQLRTKEINEFRACNMDTKEMVYMINSNLDIVKAKSLTIDERCPYLEYLTPGLDVIDNMPSPRYIKTHMPLKFLPEDLNKAKVGLFFIRLCCI
jgi:hypothetical protein